MHIHLRKTKYLKNLYNYYFIHFDSFEVDGKCVETANILDRNTSLYYMVCNKIISVCVCVCVFVCVCVCVCVRVCVCVSRTVNVAELLLHFFMSPF